MVIQYSMWKYVYIQRRYNYNSILQFINKIEYNNLLFEYRKKDKEEEEREEDKDGDRERQRYER